MINQCPNCNSTNATESIVGQEVPYADNQHFHATFPAFHCQDCKFKWTDHRAARETTLAMFKYEKSLKINRTKFTDDEEKALWEIA